VFLPHIGFSPLAILHSMMGYWRHTVVWLSFCPSVRALQRCTVGVGCWGLKLVLPS